MSLIRLHNILLRKIIILGLLSSFFISTGCVADLTASFNKRISCAEPFDLAPELIESDRILSYKTVKENSVIHDVEPNSNLSEYKKSSYMNDLKSVYILPGLERVTPESTQASKIKLKPKPVYTGKKIKLDFYKIDIKNVFMILRSVSKLNFAVDNDVEGKVTMSFQEPVPWDQVLDIVLKMNGLGKIKEGNVIRIATLQKLKNEQKANHEEIVAMQRSIERQKMLEPLVTEYFTVNYSDAEQDIKPHIAALLTKNRGYISVNKRSNMIIVRDTRKKLNMIQKIIAKLDSVTPQILIEAKVVEVNRKFSRNIGLGLHFSNESNVISKFTDEFNLSLNQPSPSGIVSNMTIFNLLGSSSALNFQLNAFEKQGDVKIISSPRILTLDNKKARIKQGVEYAYLERDDSGGAAVKFKNVDLLLEVTPHVTPDKRISMVVNLTKNDIAGITPTGIPTLATNEAETELLVNDRETVIIGGIVKNTKNNDQEGLPFLTAIPILGHLFSTVNKQDDKNELLIFLTPTIVQLEEKRNRVLVNSN